jgi:opacity protein-like surface antigen
MKNSKLIHFMMGLGMLGTSVIAIADGVKGSFLSTQDGFYLGLDIGVASLTNKESHSVIPESHQLSSSGAVGGGIVGYDYGLVRQYRIAAEIFGDATWLQTQIKHGGNTYKMDQVANMGLRVLPEYVFSPSTMGHLIIGYAVGHFQIKDNGVYGFINQSYNANALQLGAGFSVAANNNIFVRLDGFYNMYASRTYSGLGLSGPGSTQIYTNRFNQLTGEVSLCYKFV